MIHPQQAQINKANHSLSRSAKKDNRELLMLTLPGIILVAVFCYLPMIGVILAFKQFNPNLGIWGSKWIGLENFRFFFQSNDFFRLMRNTLGYNILFLITDNVFNICLAWLFYNVHKKAAIKFYQTSVILPAFMSIVLVSYVVYAFLSPTSGVVNQVIGALGGNSVDWYNKPGAWPVILTMVKEWKDVGLGCMIYYATMVGIDESLFEASKMDGATKWRQLIHIIIPELGALICLNLILGVGNIMGGDFGLFYQIPLNVGTLYETTDVFSTYTFRALQTGSNIGRTTAIGLFNSLVGTILLVISNSVIRKIDSSKSIF